MWIRLTLVEVGLVEVVRSRDIHIIQTSDLLQLDTAHYQSRILTYVAMAPEMLQQLYLTERTLGQDLLAEDIGNLLDSNTFLRLGIGSCTARPTISVVH